MIRITIVVYVLLFLVSFLCFPQEVNIDVGIANAVVYPYGRSSADLVTTNSIILNVKVRNYSSTALDNLILIPSVETYYEGTLLTSTSEAFTILPQYIDNAQNRYISIDKNGTYTFYAKITNPRAGHYRAEITISLLGDGEADAVGSNNRKTVEFDVRHKTPPEYDLELIDVLMTDMGSTFAIGYTVRNTGTKPYVRTQDMTADIYVGRESVTIMKRNDVFARYKYEIKPDEEIHMGPFLVKESGNPDAGLPCGTYKIGVYINERDTIHYNNSVKMEYVFERGDAEEVSIDLGIEKTRVTDTSGFDLSDPDNPVAIKNKSVVVTVRNDSATALDDIILVLELFVYYNNTFMTNIVQKRKISIKKNETYRSSGSITRPREGHYRVEIGISLRNKGYRDTDESNNTATVEFDVR